MQTITPNQHEKNEWSRMAQAAYSAGYNAVGDRYSVAASFSAGQPISLATFDELQGCYRSWLCFNDFKAADHAISPEVHRMHHTGDFSHLPLGRP